MTLAERIVEALVHDLRRREGGPLSSQDELERSWTEIVERKIREATGVR